MQGWEPARVTVCRVRTGDWHGAPHVPILRATASCCPPPHAAPPGRTCKALVLVVASFLERCLRHWASSPSSWAASSGSPPPARWGSKALAPPPPPSLAAEEAAAPPSAVPVREAAAAPPNANPGALVATGVPPMNLCEHAHQLDGSTVPASQRARAHAQVRVWGGRGGTGTGIKTSRDPLTFLNNRYQV